MIANAGPHQATQVVAYQRSGSSWGAPQQLASALSGEVLPAAAYSDSKPVAAWSAGSEVDGLIGDLWVVPSCWLTGEGSLAGLVAGDGGGLGLVLSGDTPQGKPGATLTVYDPVSRTWGEPVTLANGEEPLGGLQAIVEEGVGGVAVVMAQPSDPAEPATFGGGQPKNVTGMSELASINLVLVPGALAGRIGAGTSVNPPGPVFDNSGLSLLVGGGVVGLLLIAGVVTLARRRVSGT